MPTSLPWTAEVEENSQVDAELFLQPSTEPLLTSSARVSAAAASPAQERASEALAKSAPLHLGGAEPFGKGSRAGHISLFWRLVPARNVAAP